MDKAYVGIDQSYSGFAIVAIKDGEHWTSVAKFEPKKFGSGVDRLLAIQQHLYDTLDGLNQVFGLVTHVCIEGYANGRKFGREQAGELGAALKMALYEQFGASGPGYPTIVAPTALKKFASGKGTAKKNEMLLAVYKRWGFDTSDDNLADAYALARVAEAAENPLSRPWITAFQLEVVDKLTLHTERVD